MPKRTYDVIASRPLVPRIGKARGIDSVDIQLAVTVNVPKGARLAPGVIEEAIKYKCKHGKNPRGFNVKIIRWRNPDRMEGDPEEIFTNPEAAKLQSGWRKYGPQAERFGTLGNALRGQFMVYTIRLVRTYRKRRMVVKVTKHRPIRRKKRAAKVAHRRRRSKRR